jgi:hypothetical protein
MSTLKDVVKPDNIKEAVPNVVKYAWPSLEQQLQV